ncbi:MAG: tetratricopeptide repeat protein [Acidobacteriota bacterium]
MVRIFLALQTVFSLWMVVDAVRRNSSSYWYLIIMVPFGEWIYFFMVKIHDPEFEWIRDLYRRLTTKKVTVEDLRFQAEQSPSFTNKTTLAQALYDQGTYGEAAEIFTEALVIDAESRDALYGLALSQSALQEYDAAIEGFRKVIELDPSFHDYAAYTDLAHVLSQSGRMEETHELLADLVTTSPRLRHRVIRAHYLAHDDRQDEAATELRTGLDEFQHVPKYVQRRNKIWLRRAKQMLKQVSNPS